MILLVSFPCFKSHINPIKQMTTLSSQNAKLGSCLLPKLTQSELQMLSFLTETEYEIIEEGFEHRHAAHLEKKQSSIEPTIKTAEISRYFAVTSEKLHNRILKEDIDMDRTLSKLQELWRVSTVAAFHCYYFEKYVLTAHFSNVEHLIRTEHKLLSSRQHIYFSITRNINSRETCLKLLRKLLSELSLEDINQHIHILKERHYKQQRKVDRQQYQIHGYKAKLILEKRDEDLSETKFEVFTRAFHDLMKLTIHVIEQIAQWKQYIHSLTHQLHQRFNRIEFYFGEQNYYQKILGDLTFISQTFLSNYYNFAVRNDPFMLRPVLSIEQNEQEEQSTLENTVLKQMFMPENVPETMSALELLAQEYECNIKSRKMYNLKKYALGKSQMLQKDNPETPQRKGKDQSQNKQNQSLPKMSQFSKGSPQHSQRKFRIKQHHVTNREDPNSIKKPYSKVIKSVVIKEESVNNNTNNSNEGKVPLNLISRKMKIENEYCLADSRMLAVIKAEVSRKIKESLKNQQQLKGNHQLQMYIDKSLKQMLQSQLQRQKQVGQLPIQFTPKSIDDDQLSRELGLLYKFTSLQFGELQIAEKDLLKKLREATWFYLIRAHLKGEMVATFICMASEMENQRAINIRYIAFQDFNVLQTLLLKFVTFIWKFQSFDQVILEFQQPIQNTQIVNNMTALESSLQNHCLISSKKTLESTLTKFLFRRKASNPLYLPNPHPGKLSILIRGVLSQHPLNINLPSSELQEAQPLYNYNYILMQMIAAHITSEDFITLRQTFDWQHLKLLLNMVVISKESTKVGKVTELVCSNVMEMNRELGRVDEKLVPVSDLVKESQLTFLQLRLTLNLPFFSRISSDQNNQPFHRYEINTKVAFRTNKKGQKMYTIPSLQKASVSIGFMEIGETEEHLEEKGLWFDELMKREVESLWVENLWIPMFRIPDTSGFQDRQQVYVDLRKKGEFSKMGKELWVGSTSEWFSNLQLQNGIKYRQYRSDLCLKKPFRISVILDEKMLLYSCFIN